MIKSNLYSDLFVYLSQHNLLQYSVPFMYILTLYLKSSYTKVENNRNTLQLLIFIPRIYSQLLSIKMGKKQQTIQNEPSQNQSLDTNSKKSRPKSSSSFSSKKQNKGQPTKSKKFSTHQISQINQDSMQQSDMVEQKMEDRKSINSSIQSFQFSNCSSANSFTSSLIQKIDHIKIKPADSSSFHLSSNGSNNSFSTIKKFSEEMRMKLVKASNQTYEYHARAQSFIPIDIEKTQKNSLSYQYRQTLSNSSASDPRTQKHSLQELDNYLKQYQSNHQFAKKKICRASPSQLMQTFSQIEQNHQMFDKQSILSEFPPQPHFQLNIGNQKSKNQYEISDNRSDAGFNGRQQQKMKGFLKMMKKKSQLESSYQNQLEQNYNKVKSQLMSNNKQMWSIINRNKLKQLLKLFVICKRLSQQKQFNSQEYRRIKQAAEYSLYLVRDNQFVQYGAYTFNLILTNNSQPFERFFERLDEIINENTYLFTSIIAYCPIETSLLEKVLLRVKRKNKLGENQVFQNLKSMSLVISPMINQQISVDYPKTRLQVLNLIGEKLLHLNIFGTIMDETVLESLLKTRLHSLEQLYFNLPQIMDVHLFQRILQSKNKCFPYAQIRFYYLENYGQNQDRRNQLDKLLKQQRWSNLQNWIQFRPLNESQEFIRYYSSGQNVIADTHDLSIDDLKQDNLYQGQSLYNQIIYYIQDEEQAQYISKKISSDVSEQSLNLFLISINDVYRNTLNLQAEIQFVQRTYEPFFRLSARNQQIMNQVQQKMKLKNWCRQLFVQMELYFNVKQIDYILKDKWNNLELLKLYGVNTNKQNENNLSFDFLLKQNLNKQLKDLIFCIEKIDKKMMNQLLQIQFLQLQLLMFLLKEPFTNQVIGVFRQCAFNKILPCQIWIILPENTDKRFEQEFKQEFGQLIRFDYAKDYETMIETW